MAGAPLTVHSRWISPTSQYITRWPHLDWVISPKGAMPRDFLGFYDGIMSELRANATLAVYEQDWTGANYYNNPWLANTVSRRA